MEFRRPSAQFALGFPHEVFFLQSPPALKLNTHLNNITLMIHKVEKINPGFTMEKCDQKTDAINYEQKCASII